MSDDHPPILDYAKADPPRRRDAMEYFREPPEVSTWGVTEWCTLAGGFLGLLFLLVWLVGRWIGGI